MNDELTAVDIKKMEEEIRYRQLELRSKILEDVKTAREFGDLSENFEYKAAKQEKRRNDSRSRPTTGITYEPYFLKIFRQRWYVVGRNVRDNKIKTYALDRMSSVTHREETFEMPADIDPEEYFRDSFGIVVNHSAPKRITIRTDHRNAMWPA